MFRQTQKQVLVDSLQNTRHRLQQLFSWCQVFMSFFKTFLTGKLTMFAYLDMMYSIFQSRNSIEKNHDKLLWGYFTRLQTNPHLILGHHIFKAPPGTKKRLHQRPFISFLRRLE